MKGCYYKKLWEELITYFPLIRHEPHRKRRLQQLCVAVGTSLPSCYLTMIGGYTDRPTDAPFIGHRSHRKWCVQQFFYLVLLLCRRATPVGTSKNLILLQHCHHFFVAENVSTNFYLFFFTVATKLLYPWWGRWLYSPPIGSRWISLTPSIDIKIINKTRHMLKQKTNVIISTITYIQSIYTHNMQLHTLQ
jgi:hypothetical protein